MKCPLKRSKLAEKEEVCVCVLVGGRGVLTEEMLVG